MIRGHVFSKQYFGNHIFALFTDTFLNELCGILDNYKEKMAVTYNGDQLTISSGCACVRGRFIEEDSYTTLTAGTDSNYFCKLVIEVDLSKTNTATECNQLKYNILYSTEDYPTLTHNDVIANNDGIYQFELARFKTSSSGISEFVETKQYLNYKGIYQNISEEYRAVLDELEHELENVKDGSAYILKDYGLIIEEEEEIDDE